MFLEVEINKSGEGMDSYLKSKQMVPTVRWPPPLRKPRYTEWLIFSDMQVSFEMETPMAKRDLVYKRDRGLTENSVTENSVFLSMIRDWTVGSVRRKMEFIHNP